MVIRLQGWLHNNTPIVDARGSQIEDGLDDGSGARLPTVILASKTVMGRFRQAFTEVFGEHEIYLLDTTCPKGAWRNRSI